MSLQSDILKIERLVMADHFPMYELRDEKKTKIIIPGKRSTKVHPGRNIEWFDFLKNKLLTELPPGKYCFRAYIDHNKKTFSDYDIEKRKTDIFEEAQVIQPATQYNQVPSKKEANYTPMFDIKEYTELMRKIAKLEADNAVMTEQIKTLTDANIKLMEEINQVENETLDEPGTLEKISQGVQGMRPLFDALADAFSSWNQTKNRELDLMEKGIYKKKKPTTPAGKIVQRGRPNTQTPPPPPPPAKHPDAEQVAAYFDKLLNSNEEQANQELDQLEQEHPEMYSQVVQILGLEEDQEGASE